ncbi:hypothetical protein [Albibacterium profundi]|uniref:Uncharacterized protein n=1 Tax=Albibacterium profundi TaxID=3134906 RepID=A0ABV5CHI2_9SPHI
MKHLIYSTCFLFLCVSASAQEKFVEGDMTVYGKTFEVFFLKDFDAIVVDSSLPVYKDGYPKPQGPSRPLTIRKGDMKVDTLVDRNIIYDVLGDKLTALQANGDWVSIDYVFGHDGNVLDISSYSLPKNTLITPKEVALIDKLLREEVKAVFKGREYLNWPVIFYGREIRF